jgi:hypothetical protein
MRIDTKFDINKSVKIIPLENLVGRIISIFYLNQIEYRVRYFHNGELKEVYFLEDELTNE